MTEKYTFPKLAYPDDKAVCHQFEIREQQRRLADNQSVSYTHLTLPTNREV